MGHDEAPVPKFVATNIILAEDVNNRIVANTISGAAFVSGGAFHYKGTGGTVTLVGAA